MVLALGRTADSIGAIPMLRAECDHAAGLAYSITLSRQNRRLWEQWGPSARIDACPWPRGFVVDRWSGRCLPNRCRTVRCIYCLRLLRWDVQRAIALASPSVQVLITLLTGDWSEDQRRVAQLLRYLRRDGFDVQMVWAVEPNPGDSRCHAHGWAFGAAIPPRQLQQRAHAVGLGLTTSRTLVHSNGGGYLLKLPCWNAASLAAYRAVNGPHILHATKRFWRNAATGEVLTRDQAVVVARRRRYVTSARCGSERRRAPRGLTQVAAGCIQDRNRSEKLVSTERSHRLLSDQDTDRRSVR